MATTVSIGPGDLYTVPAALRPIRALSAHPSVTQIVIEGLTILTPTCERSPAHKNFDVLSQLADALDILDELIERLEHQGERVHLIPYGWNTETHAYIAGKPGSQCIMTLTADAESGDEYYDLRQKNQPFERRSPLIFNCNPKPCPQHSRRRAADLLDIR
ncbi:hypothetical protein [Nocardia sp. AB354]|uniref:hypothetical protein n=1 Tax=Nocardia sp. AB354 TaxID=3413283 RepID=UPI003C1B02A9